MNNKMMNYDNEWPWNAERGMRNFFVAFCVLTHFNAAQHYKYRNGLLKQNDILNQVYGEVLGGYHDINRILAQKPIFFDWKADENYIWLSWNV